MNYFTDIVLYFPFQMYIWLFAFKVRWSFQIYWLWHVHTACYILKISNYHHLIKICFAFYQSLNFWAFFHYQKYIFMIIISTNKKYKGCKQGIFVIGNWLVTAFNSPNTHYFTFPWRMLSLSFSSDTLFRFGQLKVRKNCPFIAHHFTFFSPTD